MSIKPSVVYIKGVHSITGQDQSSDIGFPQLELEKLFEGAALKQVDSSTSYDSNKKYIYKNETGNIAIQDEGHFNCIKNGYYSIANRINHYYTKNGNNYNYNVVPDVSTWAGKWSFSNTIKGKDLYSISLESERIFVSGNYYKKNGNNYVKQTVESYDLYDYSSSLNPISLTENNKYNRKTKSIKDEEGFTTRVSVWLKSDKSPATNGYYLAIDEIQDANENKTYNVELCYLTFDANGVAVNDAKGTLYKLEISNLDNIVSNYVKNSSNLIKFELNTPITFATNPANEGTLYVYQKLEPYTYPNTIAPESASLYTDSGSSVYRDFNINNFPLYTNATITEISKTSHASYPIYEKATVKINYNYSSDANSLKFIFTDKDIDGVLAACNLQNDIKQYVHLTNLQYNDK